MKKSLEYNAKKRIVSFLDQLKLPLVHETVNCGSFTGMCDAILSMKLRGAPLIGVSGAFGLLLWCFENAKKYRDGDTAEFLEAFAKASHEMAHVRPTAVNLKWACDRVLAHARSVKAGSVAAIVASIEKLCVKMDADDISICESIGANGAKFIKKHHGKGLRILTHCNAGSLATCGYGTAVGVIRAAHDIGILSHVLVDETRPYLQGARITAYELSEDRIPYYLICDNMAGWLMKKGEVDVIITGADRIAANGDAANKIGTYSLSVLARENKVPMYIAAPESTFDLSIRSGDDIRIEERHPDEVTHVHGVRIAPRDSRVKNPAFDVTPGKYIAGIITEHGVIEKPYLANIKKTLKGRK